MHGEGLEQLGVDGTRNLHQRGHELHLGDEHVVVDAVEMLGSRIATLDFTHARLIHLGLLTFALVVAVVTALA